MRGLRWVALGLVAMSLACASSSPRDPRARVVSEQTYERVLPFLEALKPGDSLALFARARQLSRPNPRSGRRPLVTIPAWIPSLSGGAAGGMSMLGQLIGRRDEILYGTHVFGFVSGNRIVPRFQVMTRATLVDEAAFEKLAREKEPNIGVLPRPSGVLHFRDLHVAGTRALDFVAEASLVEGGLPGGGAPAFYSESSFRAVAPMLDGLPEGTDLLSMLWILDAQFVSDDFGETHSLFARGFLNYKSARTQSAEGPAGVFKMRPFGWVEPGQGAGVAAKDAGGTESAGVPTSGEREVVKRIAIFHNDRLLRVVRHDGRASWLEYLH